MYELDVASDSFRYDPYPAYRQARQARLCLIQPYGVFALTRYADVAPALRDYRRFSSESMYTFFAGMSRTRTSALGRTLVSLDPPRHFVVRRLVSTLFDSLDMRNVERFVQATVYDLLALVSDDSALDVVNRLAVPLALRTVAWLLGIEATRTEDFLRWTDDASMNALCAAPNEVERVEKSHEEMRAYFEEKIRSVRLQPDGYFLSRLVSAQIAGELTEDELLDLSRFLLFAGNKTTRSLIGNAVIALSRQPQVFTMIRQNPEMIFGLVEELLRFDTPSQISIRTVTQSVDYDNVRLEPGTTVFLLNGSANRDESQFLEPDRLNPQRDSSSHLGLGSGTHHCLGTKVAKLQIRVLLEALQKRFTTLQIDENRLEYYPPLFLRGPSRLTLVRAGIPQG